MRIEGTHNTTSTPDVPFNLFDADTSSTPNQSYQPATPKIRDYPLWSFDVKNWRGLADIKLPTLYKQQAFVGANGTGKTSLLWAMITFVRALNCRATGSQHIDATRVSVGHDIQDLLCQESLRGAFGECLLPHGFKTLPKEEKEKRKTLLSVSVNGEKFECKVEMNGICELYPTQSITLPSKIRFAFFSGEPNIGRASKEVRVVRDDRILTPFSPNIFRLLYEDLTDNGKRNVMRHLQTLFGVQKLNPDKEGNLLITEENGTEIELVNTGTAFRKVYSILVLMYYIGEYENTQHRIFFVEEVEAFLHPSLQVSLMKLILEESDKLGIQLFITSCSSHVLKHFDEAQVF
jgi:hypothetical protein